MTIATWTRDLAVDSVRYAARTPVRAARLLRRRDHPVVLMHGFLGFNRIGPIQYFQNVREWLWLHGFPAYAPTADPLNTFEYRAYEWFYGREPGGDPPFAESTLYRPRSLLSLETLDPFVLRRMRTSGIADVYLRHRRPVHLIAHSQACTDARYLTAPEGMGGWRPFADGRFGDDLVGVTIADTIASVTTVAGPHNGVLVADDTALVSEFLTRYVIPLVDRFISALSHDESDLWAAAREFGSEYMLGEFNPNHTEHPGVTYRSVAGVTNAYQVNLILKWFHIQTRTNPEFERSDNDGFVPVGSARWPVTGAVPRDVVLDSLLHSPGTVDNRERHGNWEFLGTIYADHVNQIGIPISYPRNTVFHHLPFYAGLARLASGEFHGDVTLQPNGRWRRPRDTGMLPTLEIPAEVAAPATATVTAGT